MTAAIIIQARMTSTRLPGKVLKPILGRPLLALQLERLRRVSGAPALVIATTTNDADEAIVALARAEGAAVFRGSEHDVLSRYCGAAETVAAETVVRVTSDCPLIDPDVVDAAIVAYEEAGAGNVFVSNMFDRRLPLGMAVEVVSREALATINAGSRSAAEREHVMSYFYDAPEFERVAVPSDPDLSAHRWTVDTPEDFELVRRIYEALYPSKPDFDRDDVMRLFERHPDWPEINRHIEQKPATTAQ